MSASPPTPREVSPALVWWPALIAAVGWTFGAFLAYPPDVVPLSPLSQVLLMVAVGSGATTLAMYVSFRSLGWLRLLSIVPTWLGIHVLLGGLISLPFPTAGNIFYGFVAIISAFLFLTLAWVLCGAATGLILQSRLRTFVPAKIAWTAGLCGMTPILVVIAALFLLRIGYVGALLGVFLVGLFISGRIFEMLRSATHEAIEEAAVYRPLVAAENAVLNSPAVHYTINVPGSGVLALGADGELIHKVDDPPLVELDQHNLGN